jgi:hypothetical protein
LWTATEPRFAGKVAQKRRRKGALADLGQAVMLMQEPGPTRVPPVEARAPAAKRAEEKAK